MNAPKILLVRNKRGLLVEVKGYFTEKKPIKKKICIRGGDQKTIFFCTQKLYIDAHKKKRTVIAVKYSDEKEYRYIIATDMT